MKQSDNTSSSTVETLWSETLLDILYESLQKNRSDEAVMEVLRELRMKGMKPNDIIRKVAKKSDEKAIVRVMALLMKKFG